MKMTIEESAKKLMRLGQEVAFAGPQQERHIVALETALQVKLPPSYRSFLQHIGGGGTMGGQISGIYDSDPMGIYAGGVYSDTLRYRDDCGLPSNLLVIFALDDSFAWCLDMSRPREDGECPVVFYDCVQTKVTKTLFSSFGDFFDDYVAVRVGERRGD